MESSAVLSKQDISMTVSCLYYKGMRNLILALLLFLPFAVKATEKQRGEGDLPFNMHEFVWSAGTDDGQFQASGKGIDNELRGALVFTRHQLNKLAKDGICPDGTEFTITLTWKGVDFIRGGIARKEYPEMRRGPDRFREMERGTDDLGPRRKNSDADLRMVRDPKLIPIEPIEKLREIPLKRGPDKKIELPRGPKR